VRRTLFTAERTIAVAAGTVAALLFAGTAHAAAELVLVPDAFISVILIVAFFALIPFVNNLIVVPVFRIIDERADKIEGARKRAAKLQVDADTVLSKYESAVREVREESERGRRAAIDAARAQQAEVTGEARSEAERDIDASRVQLESSLVAARASLRASAEELAKQAAERVLGRAI
jgi:F-type H+-transporting ATPase subunit b